MKSNDYYNRHTIRSDAASNDDDCSSSSQNKYQQPSFGNILGGSSHRTNYNKEYDAGYKNIGKMNRRNSGDVNRYTVREQKEHRRFTSGNQASSLSASSYHGVPYSSSTSAKMTNSSESSSSSPSLLSVSLSSNRSRNRNNDMLLPEILRPQTYQQVRRSSIGNNSSHSNGNLNNSSHHSSRSRCSDSQNKENSSRINNSLNRNSYHNTSNRNCAGYNSASQTRLSVQASQTIVAREQPRRTTQTTGIIPDVTTVNNQRNILVTNNMNSTNYNSIQNGSRIRSADHKNNYHGNTNSNRFRSNDNNRPTSLLQRNPSHISLMSQMSEMSDATNPTIFAPSHPVQNNNKKSNSSGDLMDMLMQHQDQVEELRQKQQDLAIQRLQQQQLQRQQVQRQQQQAQAQAQAQAQTQAQQNKSRQQSLRSQYTGSSSSDWTGFCNNSRRNVMSGNNNQNMSSDDNRNGAVVEVADDVEVLPGLHLRLRGSEETYNAIKNDFYIAHECCLCGKSLFCIQDAKYVICPYCKTVDLLQTHIPNEINNTPSDTISDAGGVGLGFTFADIARWQQEISSTF